MSVNNCKFNIIQLYTICKVFQWPVILYENLCTCLQWGWGKRNLKRCIYERYDKHRTCNELNLLALGMYYSNVCAAAVCYACILSNCL